MPARVYFFKRADFGRYWNAIGCLEKRAAGGYKLLWMPYNAARKGFTDLSLLTTYRPNFCAECGDKIVRLRWRVWTSRRFCDKCCSRFVRAHWLQRTCAAIALVCFGMLIGRACRRERPPLVIQRTITTPAQTPPTQTPVTLDQLYTCGARTKKGTPCSRRVHGPVRCWQHKGAAAILPQEKLIIKE